MPADSEFVETREHGSVLSDQRAIVTAREAGVGVFDGSPVSTRIARMIPAEFSRRHRLIPVDQRRARVVVAMVDPTDAAAQETVSHITGLRVEAVAIGTDALQRLLDSLLTQDEPAEPVEPTTMFGVPPVNSRRAARSGSSADRSADDTADSGEGTATPADSPAGPPSDASAVVAQPVSAATAAISIIRADGADGGAPEPILPVALPETSAADDGEVDDVRELISAMRVSGASAVHIDVAAGRETVTARIDGAIVTWPRRGPIAAAVTHAVGIPLRRRPVAAQSTLAFDDDEAPLQVAVTPTATGQSIVLRVPERAELPDGMAADVRRLLAPVLSARRGLLLVAAGAVSTRTAALDVVRSSIDADRRVISVSGGLPVTDTVVVPATDVAELPTVLHDYDADTVIVHDAAVLGDAILDVAAEALVIVAVRAPDAAAAIHRLARLTGDGATVAEVTLAALAVRTPGRRLDDRTTTVGAASADAVCDLLSVDAAVREAIGDDVPLAALRRAAILKRTTAEA